jgi:hypothetical protein
VFCFNGFFVYLVVYVTCIVLTLPPGGQPICITMMIINNKKIAYNYMEESPSREANMSSGIATKTCNQNVRFEVF